MNLTAFTELNDKGIKKPSDELLKFENFVDSLTFHLQQQQQQ